MSLQIVFRQLVDELREVKNVRSVRVLDEGALLVNVAQPSFQEEIVIYLLAGELSVGFIKKTLNANTQRDRHTLFIVSLDLITDNGVTANMSDALRLLLLAYGGKIYAYREQEQGAAVIPVYIDLARHIIMGDPVKLADISGDYATFDTKYILGVRKVVSFNAQQFHAEAARRMVHNPLQSFYDVLEIPTSATETEVKKAYRQMARRHHPDADKSPNATVRMQQINEAYTEIMKRFE